MSPADPVLQDSHDDEHLIHGAHLGTVLAQEAGKAVGSCVNRNELKRREFTGKRHKGTFRGLIWEVAPQTYVHVERQKVSNFSSFFL